MSIGELAKFNSIDDDEVARASKAIMNAPLSGFIASQEHGGAYVTQLEQTWMAKLGMRHAISFNSATAALLAASRAINLGPASRFIVSPFTMSATAAAPAFLGAEPVFCDIERHTFGLDPVAVKERLVRSPTYLNAIFVTNLFGHCARLHELRQIADHYSIPLIEDASQSPMAVESGKFAGTIGHIGVFSLNVHKHVQCGEGGVAVTNDDDLAFRMRCVRNHGENLQNGLLGLNLRMTESVAAIACAQMDKLDDILDGRISLARTLTKRLLGTSGITLPVVRTDCRHVYYAWAILLEKMPKIEFISRLKALGVPISSYVKPLYTLGAFRHCWHRCPNAEDVYERLALFEICTYSPTELQTHQIAKAIKQVLTA